MSWIMSSHNLHIEVLNPSILEEVLFGDKVSIEIIKLKWGH